MDLLSFGFVLLIGLVSAGIAYAADMLGKKLGKKRLSLRFGRYSLRPKHVASLGTAGMGFVVSVLTIVFIALVSRDAREWLVEGRQLLVQLGERKQEVRNLETRVTNLIREKERLENDSKALNVRYAEELKKVESLKGQVEDRTASLGRSNQALSQSRSALASSQSQLAIVQRQLPPLKAQQVRLQQEVASANAALESAKKSLATTQTNLGVARKNFETVNQQLQIALNKSFDTYKKLEAVRAQVEALTKDVADREAVAATLRKQTAGLIAERDDAEAKAKAAQARYDELQQKLDQAGRELADLQGIAQQQYLFMATTFRSSRLEPMTYRAGEEVARISLPGGSDLGVVANTFASLLRTARVQAAARGAKARKREGQTFEVADVFGHQDARTGSPVSGDDLKRAVIARAAGHLEDLALVATSTLNAFAGEPVSLDVAVVPNPLVYRRNEVVAEARIDGSLDEDRILEQLSEFLRGRVRDRATQDRMIPRAGTDAPFGEVKTGEVLAIVRDVKRVGRSVRVQALAAVDTHAVDSLDLELRVR